MTANDTGTDRATAEAIAEFLEGRLGAAVPHDQDLFASGLVSSLFAMELVVHLEGVFGIAITGSDLKLDNFRTVESMTALVDRLRASDA
ncbi:acyl carrier protein [Actinokineospora guangxiensis]|uniref:Acyl carrier protein n=1 Tax=Actinokineospora guangxiensis TaxID=1490288 RepID=A0ABW0EUI0_9PSEU